MVLVSSEIVFAIFLEWIKNYLNWVKVKKLRGYISSRKFMGENCHQSTQNLVLRDYCKRMNYNYLLSGTEYSIKNSYLMLQQLVDEIPEINGIVAYSLFQMP